MITEFDQAYFDRMALLEDKHPWTSSMRLLTMRLLVKHGVRPGCSVLDAGCGTGRFLRDCQESLGAAKRVGVEYYLPPLQYAATRCKALLVAGSADALPVGDELFDAVHSADVLQHMTIGGARKALGEFARVLRRGGVVALRLRGTRRLIPNRPDEDMNHAYTRGGLAEQLRANGFEILFLERVNVLPSIVEELRHREKDDAPVKGITPREENDRRSQALRAYLRLERGWLQAGLPAPDYGHTILALGRKR